MAVTISLTGRLAIDIDGVQADEARLGRLGRVAFAMLVTERHRPVPQGELARALWGDERPADWESTLEDVVGRLRSVLAEAGLPSPDIVQGDFGCYHLRLPGGVVVDLEQAAAAVRRAERTLPGAPDQALDAATQAATIAARQFLPGAGGSWAQRRQADLATLRVRALELVSEAASASGEHDVAVAAADEAVRLARQRESAHQRLIAAHSRAGNRPAALRAFERCRLVLAEELGTSPSPETEAAYRGLLGDSIVVASSVRTNLPDSATSFVGREDQVEALRALLATVRLVTLTGPAGVGKSRLAHRIAADLLAGHPDGVWLVDLVGLGDPALVPDRILAVIGVPELPGSAPTESLLRQLAGRRALLVLDNCEHVAPACAALVDSLLARCLALRVLAASREPLGLAAEEAWPVPVLDGRDAERLFRDRAVGTAPGGDVTTLCTLLDGIPLAIELAAARTRTMGVADIAGELGERLAAHGDEPLQATLHWTYDRLPDESRMLFDRLSVFAGGFTLDAAVAVCGEGNGDIASPLAALVDSALVDSALVDSALVIAGGAGGAGDDVRHRAHEHLRQHGAERLARRGDRDDVRTRHLTWAVRLAEAAEPGLEGADQTRWLAVLDGEHDNLRVALDWAVTSGQAELGLRLAAALVHFWEIRGHLREGRALLARWAGASGLSDPNAMDGAPALRAKALNGAAVLAQRQRDFGAARACYEHILVLWRAVGDRVGTSVALHGLGNLAVADDDFDTARALFEENLAIGRELGHRRMVAASLMNLGVVAHYSLMRNRGPADEVGAEARALYEASLAAYRELGDRYGEALALENLGGLGPFVGDFEESLARHEESMSIRRELGDKIGIAASARFLATRATWSGQFATARQLHEERLVIERELGNKPNVADALAGLAEIADREGDHARARRLLGESLELYEDVGDRAAICALLGALADVARRQGDLARSRSALDAGDEIARELDDHDRLRWHTAQRAKLARCEPDLRTALRLAHEAMVLARHADESPDLEAAAFEVLAGIAVDQREFPRAARLLGAAAGTRPGPTLDFTRPADPEVDRDTAVTRAALGDDLFTAAFTEGGSLSPTDRRAYALGGADE